MHSKVSTKNSPGTTFFWSKAFLYILCASGTENKNTRIPEYQCFKKRKFHLFFSLEIEIDRSHTQVALRVKFPNCVSTYPVTATKYVFSVASSTA